MDSKAQSANQIDAQMRRDVAKKATCIRAGFRYLEALYQERAVAMGRQAEDAFHAGESGRYAQLNQVQRRFEDLVARSAETEYIKCGNVSAIENELAEITRQGQATWLQARSVVGDDGWETTPPSDMLTTASTEYEQAKQALSQPSV